MIILGVLSALITGSFFSSLKKGRDAQRKAALGNIQKAFELYYEDFKKYPSTTSISFGSPLCYGGTTNCDTKVYMATVPRDPVGSQAYRYCVDDNTNPQKYQLFAWLENNVAPNADPQIITPSYLASGAYCTSTCHSSGCNYGIASPNSSPTSP